MNLLRIAELERQLARRDARIAELEAVQIEPLHCPNCPDQGWYADYPAGVGPDGENDTRECEQVQCEFCYSTPNSVFNAQQSATPQQAAAPEIDRLKAINAKFMAELQNIANANPKNWDAPMNDTASFQAWAQSRARAAIAKVAS